jgi:hypothetical protein
MSGAETERLRANLPFRRLALVLSGGAAFGAYEVGVLRVLQRLGLRPAIVAGVSVGALNAVTWIAHGFDTTVLDRVWRGLRASQVGMRWTSLTLRAAGVVCVAVGAAELLLLLAGWPEAAAVAHFRWLRRAGGHEGASAALDGTAWLLVLVAGLLMATFSNRVEEFLSRLETRADPARTDRWAARALGVGVLLYALVVLLGIPWPRRFHLIVLLVATVAWQLGRPGPAQEWARSLWVRLVPETEGRGLWRGNARRRLIRDLVAQGDPGRLTSGEVRLIISACQVDTGRMSYFVNWSHPDAEFHARIDEALGDVVVR